jgi:DNA-binding FadR family transcriptional regulator
VHRLLPPLPSSSVAESVARRLADAIHLGLLEPGDQLPSESTLAGQLGVSTVTLREALATLREQGLVETRRGRNGGSFVCGPGAASVVRLRRRLLDRSVIGLRDFGDEWAAVAGATARLAAARSSADQVARMRTLVTRLGSATTIGDRGRAHSRFFIEIALASQSERLTRSEVRLQAETGDLLWLPSEATPEAVTVAYRLEQIVDAITDEDGPRARELAERHVQIAVRSLIDTRLALADDPT